MGRKTAKIKRFPLFPGYKGGTDGYQYRHRKWRQPTPASELWVCPACGQAEWYVPGYGSKPPTCHSTPECRKTKKPGKHGGTRMVKATPEQVAEAKAREQASQ